MEFVKVPYKHQFVIQIYAAERNIMHNTVRSSGSGADIAQSEDRDFSNQTN